MGNGSDGCTAHKSPGGCCRQGWAYRNNGISDHLKLLVETLPIVGIICCAFNIGGPPQRKELGDEGGKQGSPFGAALGAALGATFRATLGATLGEAFGTRFGTRFLTRLLPDEFQLFFHIKITEHKLWHLLFGEIFSQYVSVPANAK